MVAANEAWFCEEIGSEKDADDFIDGSVVHKIGRETEYVGVVVLATELGEFLGVATDGADALEAISLHGNTMSGTADEDAISGFVRGGDVESGSGGVGGGIESGSGREGGIIRSADGDVGGGGRFALRCGSSIANIGGDGNGVIIKIVLGVILVWA